MNFIKSTIVILIIFLGQSVATADTVTVPNKWKGSWSRVTNWVDMPGANKVIPKCSNLHQEDLKKLAKMLLSLNVNDKHITVTKTKFLIIDSYGGDVLSLLKLDKNNFYSLKLMDFGKDGMYLRFDFSLLSDDRSFVCTSELISRITKNKTI